jgi:hypothetical protein
MFKLLAASALVAGAAASGSTNAAATLDLERAGSDSALCFDSHMCLNGWGVGQGNITFHVQCNPVAGSGTGALSWCAFGINTNSSSVAPFSMYPANVSTMRA